MRRRPIRLMPDYQCFPIWEPGGAPYNVDPATLPITPELAEDLLTWADDFDRTLNTDNPISSGFPTEAAEADFRARGELLAARLASELGDGFQVTYWRPAG